MHKSFKNILYILGRIPFFPFFIRYFYYYHLNKLKKLSIDHIEDILLLSPIEGRYFIFGVSDVELVFIVNDKRHPKAFLKQARLEMKKSFFINALVDIKRVQVLKKTELETPLIRSFFVRRIKNSKLSWRSLMTNQEFTIPLARQDHFRAKKLYTKQLEKVFSDELSIAFKSTEELRHICIKMITAIGGLRAYRLVKADRWKSWYRAGEKVLSLSFFPKRRFREFQVQTMKLLDDSELPRFVADAEDSSFFLPELHTFASSMIAHLPIVDLIFTPALIQIDSSEARGKVYIDVVIDGKNVQRSDLLEIAEKIQDFKKQHRNQAKLIFRFTTYGFLKLRNIESLYAFPIWSEYRKRMAYSVAKYEYKFQTTPRAHHSACIHYLLEQFFSFRSLEIDSYLLGSKYIKSLNKIYQYILILESLKGKEFALSHNYLSIQDQVSKQLHRLSPQDIVEPEQWSIIRGQLLYLLKGIRDQLSRQYSSLRNLQF